MQAGRVTLRFFLRQLVRSGKLGRPLDPSRRCDYSGHLPGSPARPLEASSAMMMMKLWISQVLTSAPIGGFSRTEGLKRREVRFLVVGMCLTAILLGKVH